MSAAITIRQAVPTDAPGIAAVHVQSWAESYAHLVPADALARQSVAQRTLRWSELIAGDPLVWVAVADVAVEDGAFEAGADVADADGGTRAALGQIVGFASSSVGHPDAPRDLELESLYVLASRHGSGAGQSLLDAVISDRPAYLWVADNNPRARAFYTRNGFVADGASEQHPLAGTPVRAIRMVR